ncbi:hypothetical protein [Ruminococcus flavefaciens]|uniref:hypothetical protein n=1 Tax=Ruminococcus flavefaciens TaxID=1265 RepID=UPI0026EC44B0|nr:hypothetical protein [Ruminococcus flavefaciens]
MKPLRYAANKAVSGVRNIGNKLNPIDKPINKNDTSDTGVESLRLGYRTVKKGKKAANGVKLLYKAPAATIKVAKVSVKVTETIVTHIAAFLISPVFWIIVFIILIISTLIIPFILILAGGGVAGTTKSKAYGTAAGSNQVIATAFVQAENFYRIASENKQNEFNSLINSFYFSTSDLSHSDLVYMKCSHDGSEYQTSLATDTRKQQLKDKFSNSLPKAEAIALAYVYLEKQKNNDNNTSGKLYEVEFTQQAFDDLLNKMISWTETTYSGQECPTHDCARDPNLFREWKDYERKYNEAVNSFNRWFDYVRNGWNIDDWWHEYGWLYNTYPYTDNDGNDYGQYIGDMMHHFETERDRYHTDYDNSRVCVHEHNLHAIGLDIISKEAVMDSWGFDENDRQWVEMTYQFFINNPDIQTN